MGSTLGVAIAALPLAALLIGGCGTHHETEKALAPAVPAESRLTLEQASLVAEVRSPELLEIPGVTGIGIGLDRSGAAIAVVLLERAGVVVPKSLDGLPVTTEVVGTFRAFSLTGRYRPVAVGVSVGNAADCLPGTVGCVVTARNKRYLLSAGHVFTRQSRAAIGEPIAQPSLPDADSTCRVGPPRNVVAHLSDFEPVVYDGHTPNRFDAAIAELSDDATCATLPAYYGLPSSDPADPVPGAAIEKVGRTTELTRGAIKAIDVRVKITFPAGVALFTGQILTSKAFGSFGDSGALVVSNDGEFHPVAIVIGGASNGTAIASPIGPILERFGASVCGR